MNEYQPLKELVSRSQKIGADPDLVVYGGGNTSSKGEITDYLGRKRRVLWVKGSGTDMRLGTEIDYPGLYLDELLALSSFDSMSDDQMVDYVTRALVDPTSRRPSIETLLHAFLPAKHIDHVHADAICALTNHKHGKEAIKEALGEGFAYVDWIRPGFTLSKLVEQLHDFDGVVLAHHGLVVWDEDSELCYAKNLEVISKAESYLQSLKKRPASKFEHHDISDADLVQLLLKLRGALGQSQILRVDERLAEIAERKDLAAIIEAGVSSADHMLRIRPQSALIDLLDPVAGIADYRIKHQEYFERNKSLLPEGYSSHGDDPRVMLVPGVGAITASASAADGKMIADIALHTHSVAAQTIDAFGSAEPLPSAEIFNFDYWPMELFKLKNKPAPKKFIGKVFIVTGAASGIGRGIALELGRLGAQVVLADLDDQASNAVAQDFTSLQFLEPLIISGDQSNELVVQKTLVETIKAFGGVDGAVINAGIGVSDQLEELELAKWQRGLEINLTSAFLMTKEMMKALRTQNCGGSLVYIASKNAFAPGSGFGGYSVSKAGMIQLMKIAALEGGSAKIRANAINPDAVFDNSKLWEGGVREQRAAVHGIPPEDLEDFYASRNILKARVRTIDVAQTVSHLLSDESSRTTGTVIAVDGGVAAAFPR